MGIGVGNGASVDGGGVVVVIGGGGDIGSVTCDEGFLWTQVFNRISLIFKFFLLVLNPKCITISTTNSK